MRNPYMKFQHPSIQFIRYGMHVFEWMDGQMHAQPKTNIKKKHIHMYNTHVHIEEYVTVQKNCHLGSQSICFMAGNLLLWWYEPHCEKPALYLMRMFNKGADQPVHQHSLIGTFVSIISILAKSKISRLQLAAVAEQSGLCLTWSQTPIDRFSHDVAHMSVQPGQMLTFWLGLQKLYLYQNMCLLQAHYLGRWSTQTCFIQLFYALDFCFACSEYKE